VGLLLNPPLELSPIHQLPVASTPFQSFHPNPIQNTPAGRTGENWTTARQYEGFFWMFHPGR